MSFTKRQERHIRTLAALPTDNLGPDDYATLDVLVTWAGDEVGKLDRKAERTREAKDARKARQKARDGDGVWSEAAGYAAVDARSGGRCEHPFVCRSIATVHHHIAGRGGSDPHNPANLLHLCQWCHYDVHTHPKQSYTNGTMRRRTGTIR